MLDFVVVERAVLAPSRSITGDTEGPFVDTMVNLAGWPGQRRVYLSERDVRRAARLLGWSSQDDASGLVEEIGRLREQVRHLEADLEMATASQVRVVSLDDARALVSRKGAA